MFYGYDQGVMSQVNLNPHYQELMGIAPIEGLGVCSSYTTCETDSPQVTLETSLPWAVSSLSTTEEP